MLTAPERCVRGCWGTTTVDRPDSRADQRAADEQAIARELVARIRDGSTVAEGELVLRYRPGLVFVLTRNLSDAAQAEDLAQEALTVVLLRLRERGLDDPDRLAGFIHRTALNLVRNEVRKAVRRRTDSDEWIEQAADSTAGPMDVASTDDTSALARRLLEEMSNVRDREILKRFYVLDEDKAGICADMELSSLHFNRVLHRARRRFRELLEDRLSADDLTSLGD
jgi:RNA polymerase sigma-70 factor, ECF subfamily